MQFMVLNILYFWYFGRVTLFNQGVVVRLAWKFSGERETVFALWQDVISWKFMLFEVLMVVGSERRSEKNGRLLPHMRSFL